MIEGGIVICGYLIIAVGAWSADSAAIGVMLPGARFVGLDVPQKEARRYAP